MSSAFLEESGNKRGERLPGRWWHRLLARALALPASLWTRAQEARIEANGMTLPPRFHKAARQLGLSPESISICMHRDVPAPFGGLAIWLGKRSWLASRPVGMTLGRGINLARDPQKHPELLLHELVHVRQFQELESHRRFLERYLAECLVHGYRDAPLEAEARHLARELLADLPASEPEPDHIR